MSVNVESTSVPVGCRVKVNSGGYLEFSSAYSDSSEAYFSCFVSFRAIPDPTEQGQHQLECVSAIVDADGTWWQMTQVLDKWQILRHLALGGGWLETTRGRWPGAGELSDMAPPRLRYLTEQMHVMFDSREELWLSVTHQLPGVVMHRPNSETHVFRLHLKYFALDVQLVERVVIQRTDGSTFESKCKSSLVTTHDETESTVTLLSDGGRRLDPQHRLSTLGPLFRATASLPIDWRSPDAAPTRADGNVWIKQISEVGIPADVQAQVTGNSAHIRFIPDPR